MDDTVATLTATMCEVTAVDVSALSDGEVHRGLVGSLAQRSALDAAIHQVAAEWTARGIWCEDGHGRLVPAWPVTPTSANRRLTT